MSLLAIATILFYARLPEPLSVGQMIMRVGGAAVLIILYVIARRVNPTSFAPIITGIGSATVLILVSFQPAPAALFSLTLLICPLFFATLTLSPAMVGRFVVLHLILILLTPAIVSGIDFTELISRPFTFNLTMGVLVYLVTRFRKRLETDRLARLSASEQRYRLISELMSDYAFCTRINPNGVWEREWITDSFKRFTGFDDATSFVMKTNLFHPDDRERIAADIQRVQAGEQVINDYRIIKADGEVRWVQIERLPEVHPVTKRVERYYGVVHDITERRQAEEARLKHAVEQERMLLVKRFIEGVSHDFRTTVSQVETSRYLLERMLPRDLPNRPEIDQKITQMQTAVNHMSSQLESFDTIGSLTAMTFHPLEVNALVEEIATHYQFAAGKRGLKLTLERVEGSVFINGNQKELSRAIRHLVNNALSHTPSGGVITMRTVHQGERVAVEVQDTGSGIPADQIQHIFDFFYRVDSARSVDVGGVGLGLSIVRMIVEAHQGRIDVRSQPNEGTVFTLTFPITGKG